MERKGKSKGDRFRRIQAICDNSESNDRLAADVSSHIGELSTLIVDSTSREAFNLAYMSLSRNYAGDDVVSEFRRAFYGMLRELSTLSRQDQCVIIPYNDAISQETEEETEE